jgi:hypothetical protein
MYWRANAGQVSQYAHSSTVAAKSLNERVLEKFGTREVHMVNIGWVV